MNNIEFYEATKQELLTLAMARGLDEKDLNKYYSLTNKYIDLLKGLSGISIIFAQLLMHASNATLISSIVDFENNVDYIKDITSNFNPNKFIEKYKINTKKEYQKCDKIVLRIVDDLRNAFKWNSYKTKEENKDSIAKRFALTMIDAAIYTSKFKDRNAFLDDLLENYVDNNIKSLVNHFRSEMKHGFGVPLACDFLKEFDKKFDNIAKPDIHILDVLRTLNNKDYKNEKGLFECISDLRNIVQDVNRRYPDEGLTVYKLDRMIWLVCSNKFFLHDKMNSKKEFIEKISKSK